jgi:hypothetical protein
MLRRKGKTLQFGFTREKKARLAPGLLITEQ